MITKSNLGKILLASIILSSLGGCITSKAINQKVDQENDINSKKISQFYDNYGKNSTANQSMIVEHSGYYYKKINRNPLWLQDKIYISGSMNLNRLLSQIFTGTPVNYSFTGEADPNLSIDNITIDGTITQALNYISALTNYHYEVNNNTLTLSDITTKTFYINAIPGESTFGLGQTGSDYTIGNIQASGSGDSGSGGSSTNQFSTADGKINHWQDVDSAIQKLLSQDGKLTITQSDSSVTITDHWSNIKKIDKWVKEYNHQLNQQISFRVQILTVQLSHEYAQGIDWSAVIRGANIAYNSNIGFASVLDSAITSSLTGSGSTLTVQNKDKYNILINSLQRQGKVSISQEPIITSLNNQAAEIKDIINTAYLQSVQNSLVPTGSTTASQNTLTPGNIITGLELHILPHVTNDGDIFLRVSAGIGDLTDLRQIGTVNSGNGIQLPVMALREFNQNAVLRNGQTLVIAGFKVKTNKRNDVGHFDVNALGSASGLSSTAELVLLITPNIDNDTQG